MPEPLTAEQRARKFVERHALLNQYPEYWIAELTKVILEAELEQLKHDKQSTLAILGQVKS